MTSPTRFLQFLGPPFPVTRRLSDAVRSCADHIAKFNVFASLASDLHPKLALDLEELNRHGYTQANHSRQFAAMVEVLVCELYSILDGIRYTLFALYGRCRGVQQKSTSQLFSRAAEQAYGADFPEEIRALLAAAYGEWFSELRRLRTAFTHGGLGFCSLDSSGNRVSYMNPSLGDTTAHVVPDIVSHVTYLSSSVFQLVDGVFGYLFSRLDPVETDQMCGVFRQRIYMRRVAPSAELNSGSGHCASRQWFDSEAEFRCPRAETCEAYRRGSMYGDGYVPA